MPLAELALLLHFLCQKIIHCFLVSLLLIRKLTINLRLCLLELRMRLCKTRIICLKRGYFSPYECNLTSKFWHRCTLSDHPVKCVNVFLQCYHNRISLMPNL